MKSAPDQNDPRQEGGIDSQLIAAFVPPGIDGSRWEIGSGNLCQLFMLANAPSESVQSGTGLTLCQSWPTTHGKQSVIAVSCYTPDGHAIQCCGHGLLAAAYSWQQRLQRSEVSLLMNNTLVPSWRDQQAIWLRFERLPTKTCAVPDWVMQVFPGQPQPIAAAVCSNEQGYLVLQWPDGFDLHRLSQPADGLSEQTQRALICTSARPSMADDAIQLRYFAPQYGVPEDTATGSALRVLADYWSPRFTHLTARQCSERGGLLLARSTSGHIEVGGHCYIMETREKYG
jgi:predicted PhzF superfamily epimerase YddE/YHI9